MASSAKVIGPEVRPMVRRPLPAWPVDALLWGFPLWWVLGMTPFIVVLLALVMAVLLIHRRGLRLVPGIAPWLAFVAWVIPCGLMLGSVLRVVGYGQRFANYLAIAVVLVYVVNARERITARRVVAGLTVVWLFVVFGGYLGTLFPEVRLTTPVGVLLPESLTNNEYVRDLVSPPFAEIQHPWGAAEPYERPAAPFPYANGWGSAMALLTPVAFAQYAMTTSNRVRLLIILGTAAIAVPAMASLNRGMFIGLAIAVGYVAARLALRGAILPFLAILSAAIASAVVFLSAGLLDELTERADYGSNDGRAQLYLETIDRTLDSPVLGYGAPRPSQLLDISVGTQGHLWMLMFSYGFVGLGLFLWFLYGAVLRTWRAPSTAQLWLHSVLIIPCALMFFYGIDTMQMLTVALVAVILLSDPAVCARRPRLPAGGLRPNELRASALPAGAPGDGRAPRDGR
ncbi:hypothetical protein EV191_101442 [Tamaricihabitans halophyticus]|uniref:O-antigen ligase-related domain-containing protein n=1 Tax=Tamaricihabitans halophyticus TaxID=1262583 RepID=A0A4R2R436_9PSEU|nr:O-antigen ligase family protein [Tamaricihabitans halophyticus]TCP56499.1 hypothetical protein EV191_101442 [Tamaricihabitans halophyticus]